MTSTPLGSPYTIAPALPATASASGAGWFTPTMLASAAVALGLALQMNFGQYDPLALRWLTLALLACTAAAMLPNFGRLVIANWRPDQLVLAVGLAVQFALLWSRDPAATITVGTTDELAVFKSGVALAGALVAVGVSATRVARFAVPLLLLAHLALGVWVIQATPSPGVDVFVFQRDACAALLNGHNAYAITFPDIYGGKLPVYGPGVVGADGRLNFGYPYPPLSLLLALPGHLAGDFRYAQLVALTLAGALLAYARPGERGGFPGARAVAAAALLLFTPRGFFVVEAGWTEPFAMLMLAATVFAACRRGRAWAIACAISFGLLLASKQYLVLALPLMLLLPVAETLRGRSGMMLVSLLVAAAVTAPLALWDVNAFTNSAVTLQFRQPFRADALSYLVPLNASGRFTAPAWLAFACAAGAILAALWRCPRTPAGFAVGLAMVLFVFFATSKQAFCNYYALVLSAMCAALAALPGFLGSASSLSRYAGRGQG